MSRALTFNSLYSHLLKVFYKYITHSQAKGNNKGFSSKEEVRKLEIEVLALLMDTIMQKMRESSYEA